MITRTQKTIRLREINSLDVAAAWLRDESSDFDDYEAADILEEARRGKIELLAVVPEWQSTGEINWLNLEKTIVDSESGAYTFATASAVDFLGSNGRIRVSPEIAQRLLEHGECSFNSIKMPIIDCSNTKLTPSDAYLQGTHDGRLIKIEHIRVTKAELLSFSAALTLPTPRTNNQDKNNIGVTKRDFLDAPWQYVHGYTFEKLDRYLREPPDWVKKQAMTTHGRRGRNGSALWNPALLAFALSTRKKILVQRQAGSVINDYFPDFFATWKQLID